MAVAHPCADSRGFRVSCIGLLFSVSFSCACFGVSHPHARTHARTHTHAHAYTHTERERNTQNTQKHTRNTHARIETHTYTTHTTTNSLISPASVVGSVPPRVEGTGTSQQSPSSGSSGCILDHSGHRSCYMHLVRSGLSHGISRNTEVISLPSLIATTAADRAILPPGWVVLGPRTCTHTTGCTFSRCGCLCPPLSERCVILVSISQSVSTAHLRGSCPR